MNWLDWYLFIPCKTQGLHHCHSSLAVSNCSLRFSPCHFNDFQFCFCCAFPSCPWSTSSPLVLEIQSHACLVMLFWSFLHAYPSYLHFCSLISCPISFCFILLQSCSFFIFSGYLMLRICLQQLFILKNWVYIVRSWFYNSVKYSKFSSRDKISVSSARL